MNEKAKAFLGKAKEKLGKISKKIWIIGAVLVVVIAAGITIYLNSRPYAVLFTGLSREEINSVTSFLETQGVKSYRVEGNDTILVPSELEPELKMDLAMADYPETGFGYSTYYDNVGSLATESERTTAYLLLLNERLGACIRTLDGVRNATVTLTPGTDRTYILDSSNMVSAQALVVVEMEAGATMPKKYASAIAALVSRALQDLDVNNVTIVDSYGNQYSSFGGLADTEDTSALKLQLEEEYNNRIRTRIMQVLIPLYGEENVRTEVNTTIDINQTIQDLDDVRLPDWAADGSTDGKGIIGSTAWEQRIIRGGDEQVGGVVGSQVNSDLNEYVNNEMNVNGDEQEIYNSGQTDYLHSTTKTHVERTAGIVTDCMVSITINSTTAGAVNLESIRDHAARQAGITPEYADSKISVLAQPFYERPVVTPDPAQPFLGLPSWALYAALGGLALFLILLVVLLLLRSKRKKKRRKEEEEQLALEMQLQAMLPGQAAAVALADGGGADVMGIQTEKSMELRREIRKFVDENPEIAAQMIRSLLRGGEENA